MFEGGKAEGVLYDDWISAPISPKFPLNGGFGEGKSYGHDFLLFAWETVELMPVDNVSIIIRVLSVLP